MKRFVLLLIFTSTLLHSPAQTTSPFFKPNTKKQPVNDYTGILTNAQTDTLQNKLQRYLSATGNVIVLIIIPALTDSAAGQTYTIEEAAQTYFNNWGIGSKKKNNGVLLLVALKSRKVRIALGAGFKGKQYDAVCQQIIDNDIVPRFKQSFYYEGIKAAISSIQKRLFSQSKLKL
jgi:uncharacterized protein